MSGRILVTTLALWFVGGGFAAPQDEQEATSTAEIMREKLEHAQTLLEAVVLRDYANVVEEAERLHYLSEFQSWYVLPTPEYARHSEEFRAAAKAAVSAGSQESAEGISESYATMIKKCVECHEYMTRVREQ